MKFEEILALLEQTKNECLVKVDNSSIIADYMDKSANSGVEKMCLAMQRKIYAIMLADLQKEGTT